MSLIERRAGAAAWWLVRPLGAALTAGLVLASLIVAGAKWSQQSIASPPPVTTPVPVTTTLTSTATSTATSTTTIYTDQIGLSCRGSTRITVTGIPTWAVNVSVVGPDGMTGGKGEATIVGTAGDYLLTAVSPFGPPAMEYDVRKGRCVQQ
ncbi:hypothetical protein [Nostocoides jenkinsii]|uniref:Uncharacterized protein n=1 Tax=Nostocoides jenkinsii Ben 74 TaxID=1193518 RepID=A0A077MDX9_9MICO|nr:hypothetical protein [Tetrasphaera jenkinsii]CCI53023.1 exported hypothetical protein [Tetrasphaera jenkinsii Ben 74]